MKAKEGDKRIGNQFWKLRSKHGRDKLFATPELLLEAAYEYFEWCQEHPWIKQETTTGNNKNDIKTIPTERPFTITGLCIYLDCNSQYFKDFKDSLPEGEKDFSLVIKRIEEIIYTQKFEGAAVGTFNSNIIARDLGLKDVTEHSGEIKTNSKITGILFEVINPQNEQTESKD